MEGARVGFQTIHARIDVPMSGATKKPRQLKLKRGRLVHSTSLGQAHDSHNT